MNYTPEQIKDIQEREVKGLEVLKGLGLTPAASVQKQNIGNDVFVDKVIPYLQDTTYAQKTEPVKEAEKPVEDK